MPFYQIIVPIICLYLIFSVYHSYKTKRKSFKEFIAWVIIFGAAAVVALDPRWVDFAKYLTGFQDSINAAIFLSIGIVFLVLFRLVLLNEGNEHKIDDIVKALAVRDFKIKYGKCIIDKNPKF
jgi:hypothetical protein